MLTRRTLLTSAFATPLAVLDMCASSQTKPVGNAQTLLYNRQVGEMAEKWRGTYGFPAVWCALIKDNVVVAKVATGYRNLEDNEKATLQDHIALASVSKVITGSLISFFVADGTITYETTLGDTFPELKRKYPTSLLLRATLRQFLAHTSGLLSSTSYPLKLDISPETSRYNLVDRLTGSPNLNAPDTKYEYVNGGLVIAAAMVERKSGSKIETWINGQIGKK